MKKEELDIILRRFCAQRNNAKIDEIEIVSEIKVEYDFVINQNLYIFTYTIHGTKKEIHVSESVLQIAKSVLTEDDF